jgi:hypothetical protein
MPQSGTLSMLTVFSSNKFTYDVQTEHNFNYTVKNPKYLCNLEHIRRGEKIIPLGRFHKHFVGSGGIKGQGRHVGHRALWRRH